MKSLILLIMKTQKWKLKTLSKKKGRKTLGLLRFLKQLLRICVVDYFFGNPKQYYIDGLFVLEIFQVVWFNLVIVFVKVIVLVDQFVDPVGIKVDFCFVSG